MHLLYFVQYFPPEKASGLSLVTDMLEAFVQYGWDVDVYVPTPTRGVTDEVRGVFSRKRNEVLLYGKLRIHRMHLYRERKGMIQRTIRYCIFSMQCLIRGLFLSADAVFTGGGPPTQGVIGGLIHKWTRKKFIYNPQDLFPDSLIVAGETTENSMIIKIGRKMERFAYKNADAIITITEDMAQNIRSKTDDKSKIYIVRNWIDTEKVKPISREENRLFDELHLDRNKFYVVYAGNIGKMQGLEVIVEAADLLKDKKGIEFILFGNGSRENDIRKMVSEKGLRNFHLYPLQPLDRVSEVYSLGDISVISCKAGTGGTGMPSKTSTIMATGTTILGSFDTGGELDSILNEAKCGYCVEAGDANKLKQMIDVLFHDSQRTKTMGKNARKYAETYLTKEKAVTQYIKIIEKYVSS